MTHMEKDLNDICDMKDSLMRKVRGKMDDLDVERSTIQDVQGMDMMINMIHHLAEAEKCCWEARYYKTVVKAMKDGDDRQDWDDDDDDWMQHDDTPKRRNYDRMVGRRRYGMERSGPGGRRDPDRDYMTTDGSIEHTGMDDDWDHMDPKVRMDRTVANIKSMWNNTSDVALKRQMKADLSELVNEMKV